MSFPVIRDYQGIEPKNQTYVIPHSILAPTTLSATWKPVVLELTDDIDTDTAKLVYTKLREAEDNNQPFVPMYIHSNGGDVYSLMAIVESMRRCKVPIYTYTSGFAASCAACIFACGKRRIMGRNARLLIHDVSMDLAQDSTITTSNISVEAREMRNLNRTILQIMAENVGHDANYFTRLIKNTRNNDIYVDAARAIELKLATDIGYPCVKIVHSTTMDLEFTPDTVIQSQSRGGPLSTGGSHGKFKHGKGKGKKRAAVSSDDDDDESTSQSEDDDNDGERCQHVEDAKNLLNLVKSDLVNISRTQKKKKRLNEKKGVENKDIEKKTVSDVLKSDQPKPQETSQIELHPLDEFLAITEQLREDPSDPECCMPLEEFSTLYVKFCRDNGIGTRIKIKKDHYETIFQKHKFTIQVLKEKEYNGVVKSNAKWIFGVGPNKDYEHYNDLIDI